MTVFHHKFSGFGQPSPAKSIRAPVALSLGFLCPGRSNPSIWNLFLHRISGMSLGQSQSYHREAINMVVAYRENRRECSHFIASISWSGQVEEPIFQCTAIRMANAFNRLPILGQFAVLAGYDDTGVQHAFFGELAY